MKNIKYTRLNFVIQLEDVCILPKNKTSMLSRLFLNQLCQLYCINNKKCKNCSNINHCIIQQIMNGNFSCNEALMKQDFYYPYVVFISKDCTQNFNKNDLLKFEIRAFDFAVNLISQFIYIFEKIGEIGVGKNKTKFNLLEINNEMGQNIYKEGLFIQSNIIVGNIIEYIKEKGAQLKDSNFNTIRFVTPVVVSSQSINKYNLNIGLIGEYIKVRLKSFNILEDQDYLKIDNLFLKDNRNVDYSLNINHVKYAIKKGKSIYKFLTLTGYITFHECIDECINYIKACEMFSIGEKVLMGFGKYELEGGKKYE
ncbi:hypothetical protein [Clostridium sp.]|uniref:hypothetical protein n=1 Tax=Clostridium sp. TaxID=1506 RepID=UPI003A165BFA